MAASEGLRYAFSNLFSHRRYISYEDHCHRYRSVPHKQYYAHFLEIPINRNHIEFPICVKNHIESRLTIDISNPLSTPLEKVIVPLFSNGYLGTIKTADSILRKFLLGDYNVRFFTASNGSADNVYHGGIGIVFDKDFNILMSLNSTADFDEEKHLWKYGKPILRVNPCVFEHPQEFMNKAIIQKIIPLCMEPVTTLSYCMVVDSGIEARCKVVIDDVSKWVVSPPKPSPNYNINEMLNQVAVDNIGDIMDLVR